MSETVEVRIRAEMEADGTRLCEWPVSDLQSLIGELSRWGVYDGDETRHACSGQFSLIAGPHFEIIVHDE